MKGFYKTLRNAGIISLAVFLLFFLLNWGYGGTPWNWDTALSVFTYTSIVSFVFYLGNAVMHDWVLDLLKISWEEPLKRIGIGLSVVFVVSVILSFLTFLGFEWSEGRSMSEIRNRIFSPDFWSLFNRVLWISITVSVTFIVVSFIQFTRETKQVQQEIIIRRVTQTNEALKAQIGPHFLFNSLNVLSGLTEENPEKAQDFIADLSRVYRYVLEQSEKDLVRVSEEIAFARNYLQLVQTRFENGLKFDIEPGLEQDQSNIIPLGLQLLLENCIKHNRISTRTPLHIRIRKIGNFLEVKNNLNPKQNMSKSTGTGLANIQGKYALFGNENIRITTTEEDFCVGLPLLNQDITIMENINEQDYKEAKERVEELRGFYWHLVVYIAVNAFIVFLSIYNGSGYWFLWPLFGWGIGLFFHAVGVFGFFNVSKSWEEKKIREIVEKRQKERRQFQSKS